MKLSVVIPAYNEASRIRSVIDAARLHLPVLVVDDGSADNTVEIARLAGAEVLCQFPNQGKGMALKAGYGYALSQGYDAAITLDADGQHDPVEIPLFVQVFFERSSDLLIGARDFSRMPFSRRFANSSGRVLFSWAVEQPVRDNQSGYRLVSRRMMEAALASDEKGFEFEVEMIVTCVQRGYCLDWVPIRTIYAGQGSHIHPLRHTLGFLRLVWRTRRRMRRSQETL